MLTLTREPGQAVKIGPAITLRVRRIGATRVELYIDAPDHLPVQRAERQHQPHTRTDRRAPRASAPRAAG